MKKFILMGLLLAIVSITAMGCTSCQSTNTKQDGAGIQPVEDAQTLLSTAKAVLGEFTVVPVSDNGGQLVAERVISTDREWALLNIGNGYDWFETEVKYAVALNDASQTGEIEQVRNVFQKATDVGDAFNVNVYQAFTTKDGTVYIKDDGFWLEDLPLNDAVVNLTFSQAYEKLMQSNTVKPASKYCVLRKPVGPSPDQHPLYIFGNPHNGVVAVDAVTGKVLSMAGV